MNEPLPDSQDTSVELRINQTEELASIHQMLADLEDWAKQLAIESREAEDLHEKMYYSRLPEALFHATTQANAKRIMLEGLQPHQLEYEPESVVSLSGTIDFARFCASVTQDTDDLVILEITTQGLNREQAKSFLQLPNKIKPGEPLHEVHYLEPISSDYIYELTVEQIQKIEAKKSKNPIISDRVTHI
ncbi:hypothetical protein H0W80_01240 [Candidatus Saccharibacteria bacterium]|nr:hypothetical protein [Candidatus Saccharibacteria bacterium]